MYDLGVFGKTLRLPLSQQLNRPDVIHRACYLGNYLMTRALLDGGFFDVNIEGNKLQTRPIHSAAAGGHAFLIKYISLAL